jgi:hypothetical protein
MIILSGIKNAEYLAQFLGKKIAIKSLADPSKYFLFPRLFSISDDRTVVVKDAKGTPYTYPWDACENPYILLQTDVEIIIK